MKRMRLWVLGARRVTNAWWMNVLLMAASAATFCVNQQLLMSIVPDIAAYRVWLA